MTTRRATVFVNGVRAGALTEDERGKAYTFAYDESYNGQPVSLTMPLQAASYEFKRFPPFFDGLLPEGVQLEAMLRQQKIDKDDLLSQLIAVGKDLVGNVTVTSEEPV